MKFPSPLKKQIRNVRNARFVKAIPVHFIRRFGCIAGVLSLLAMTSPAHAVTGTYVIGIQLSGRTVEVVGASTATGASVDQWQYTAGNHQQWAFTDLGTGYHKILNVKSGLALTRSGGTVVQTAYTGTNDQQWALTVLAGGWYKIINRGNGQSLDVANNNPMNANPINLYGYSGGFNQTFFLVAPASWASGNVTVPVGSSIQAAIDQVGTLGGGTVNLAAGTHSLAAGASIRIRSNVNLRGAGVSSTIVNANFGVSTASIIDGASGYGGLLNMTVQNFTLQANNAAGGGIGIGGATGKENNNLTLKDLSVLQTGGNGINCGGNITFLMQNITLVGCGKSGLLHSVYNRRVFNYTMRNVRSFDSTEGAGFKCSGGSNWLIEDCISTGNAFDGLVIQDSPDQVTIRNCVFDNNGRGGNIGATNMTIQSCTFNNNAEQGLLTPGGSGTITNCTSTGNVGTNFEIHGSFTGANLSDGNYNGRYQLRPFHSGKSVEVAGSSTANAANVDQWTYSGGNHQKWDVADQGGGQYRFLNVNSAKAMEVAGASTANGANVQQNAYTGATSQKWTITNVGKGLYRLTAVHSGKVLDVVGNSQADGANVDQWTDNGGPNQKYYLIPR